MLSCKKGYLIFVTALSMVTVCGFAETPSPKPPAVNAADNAAIQVINLDKTEVSFTWEQLLAGSAQLTLSSKKTTCNQTKGVITVTDVPNAKAFPLTMVPDRFTLTTDSPIRVSLTLSNANSDRPTPGSYLATISLSCVEATTATPTSIPVKLIVSPPRLGPDKVYFVSKRSNPFSDPWSETVTIPLAIPAPLNLVSGAKPRRIGFLHRDPQEIATVDWASTQTDKGDQTAAIKINGLSRAGKYEGDISLQGFQDKGASTALVVVTKDVLFWPIATIVLGILLAWAAKWYLGMQRVIWTLEKQSSELPQFLNVGGQPPPAAGGYSVQRDLARRRANIDQAIKAMWTLRTTSLTANPTYKDVVDQLTTMKSQLIEFSTLAKEHTGLETELATAENLQMPEAMILDETMERPSALITLSHALTQGREIRVDGIVGTTNRMIAASNALRVYAATLRELQTTSTQFLAAMRRNNPQDQNDLKEVETHLALAWHRLWRATTADDIAAISASGSDLESADIGMATVIARHPKPKTFGAESSKNLTYAERRGNILFHLATGTSLLTEPGVNPDQRRIRSLATALRLGDLASIVLALAIALVTGLNSFYLGKAFGTPQDYAALFLWAAGTKVGLDLVTAVTDRLLSYL